MVCDVCGKPLKTADTRIVTPNEMRVIAQNGYGETVSVLQALPMDQRRTQFTNLAMVNDTDWALCPKCWSNAQPYTAASNPSGTSVRQMEHEYERVTRPRLEAMMGPEDHDGPEQAWPKLSNDIKGSNPLQDAMNAHLTEAKFACPSCGAGLLYVQSFNAAVSPYLADVDEWDIPHAIMPHLSAVAERLRAIKSNGFREEYTRAECDAFDCNDCNARLSLSRAFAGQYPKAQRRSSSSRSARQSHSTPSRNDGATKQKSGGGGFALLVLIAAVLAAGIYFLLKT